MWLKVRPLGNQQASIGVDQSANWSRHLVFGDQHGEIIVDGDQTPVEHPMYRAAQGHAVPHGIRPVGGHRPDVGCLYLGPATAIDDPQAGHGAGLVVGRP